MQVVVFVFFNLGMDEFSILLHDTMPITKELILAFFLGAVANVMQI